MNQNNKTNIKQKNPAKAVDSTADAGPKAKAIKLGIDVHAAAMSLSGKSTATPRNPHKRFTPAQFLIWAQKQAALAEQVFSCYDATDVQNSHFAYILQKTWDILLTLMKYAHFIGFSDVCRSLFHGLGSKTI
jgi:hypothetical protein